MRVIINAVQQHEEAATMCDCNILHRESPSGPCGCNCMCHPDFAHATMLENESND